jgi:hypothetical protein
MIFLKHSFASVTEHVLTFDGFQADNIMGRGVEKDRVCRCRKLCREDRA